MDKVSNVLHAADDDQLVPRVASALRSNLYDCVSPLGTGCAPHNSYEYFSATI